MATQLSITITPFPITSSSIPSPSDGGGGAFVLATPLPIALTIGTVVPLLVIIIVLAVAVIVLVAIMLKTKQRKDRKSKIIPTDPNVAYGLHYDLYQDVDSIIGTHTYEQLPSLSTSSINQMRNAQQSLTYNEVYAGRNKALATDFLDANEAIL